MSLAPAHKGEWQQQCCQKQLFNARKNICQSKHKIAEGKIQKCLINKGISYEKKKAKKG